MTSEARLRPEAEPEVLTCPECAASHEGTLARIGNRKSGCATCNRFAQRVRRHVARELVASHPDEAARLRLEAEPVAYGQIVGTTVNGQHHVGSTDGARGTP